MHPLKMNQFKFSATLAILLTTLSAIAEDKIQVVIGQSVVIALPVDSPSACNLAVLRGGEKTNVTVEASSGQGRYTYRANKLGDEKISWVGELKLRGLRSLLPCNAEGSLLVKTIEDRKGLIEPWLTLLEALPDEFNTCVKSGLSLTGFNFSLEPNAVGSSIKLDSPEGQDIVQRCKDFLSTRRPWPAGAQSGFSCDLENVGKTVCEGYYASLDTTGRIKKITFSEAQTLALQGKTWSALVSETEAARTKRLNTQILEEEARRNQELALEREKIRQQVLAELKAAADKAAADKAAANKAAADKAAADKAAAEKAAADKAPANKAAAADTGTTGNNKADWWRYGGMPGGKVDAYVPD